MYVHLISNICEYKHMYKYINIMICLFLFHSAFQRCYSSPLLSIVSGEVTVFI